MPLVLHLEILTALQTQKLVYNLLIIKLCSFVFIDISFIKYLILWKLTYTVSHLAYSTIQALRLQQTTLESLAQGPRNEDSFKVLAGETRCLIQ